MEVLDRHETYSACNSAEWQAEKALQHLEMLQSAYYIEFTPSESFRQKVDMLQARQAAIVDEVSKLQPEGGNV
jgi:hypothetical protein